MGSVVAKHIKIYYNAKKTPPPYAEMERRFNVVPILAVVLHNETSNGLILRDQYDEDTDKDGESEAEGDEEDWEPGHDGYQVAGFLTPYTGCSLELAGAKQLGSDTDYDE